MSKTFQVTMLDVVRPDFEVWLASRGLVLAQIPDAVVDPNVYIVVPREMTWAPDGA